ncbi:MAG: PDZ domain-containing protein, partial [Clostridia bacterium]|nr:PDZ domain-containing protein [Clostridia bacterium]
MENQPIKQENEVQSHETAESALINAETEQAAEKSPKKAKPSGGTIYKYVVLVLFLITFGLTSAVLGIKIYLNLKGEPYDKLFQIEKLVSDEFFGEVDEIRLEDYLASAYIASLDDDYAFYKNAKDGERVEDSFVGNTTGIGVTVYSDDESKALAVYRVDLGSPADEAGVKAGDKIIAIDD